MEPFVLAELAAFAGGVTRTVRDAVTAYTKDGSAAPTFAAKWAKLKNNADPADILGDVVSGLAAGGVTYLLLGQADLSGAAGNYVLAGLVAIGYTGADIVDGLLQSVASAVRK